MADQAQQDNALLNAEDRAALTRRLDSHIAFLNSAKTDDADKIAPGGQAKRAEFITDYIAKLEKEWEANPGKGTFKSTVLTSDGNFSARFQKKLETLGDAFKAYEIERAEQAGIAANADTAQLVDASIAGPAVEIKDPTQNKDAAAQKDTTEKLRSHLAALAKEFSESAPENKLSDDELKALIGNYLIKRRDKIAKDANTKPNLASDASALNADGTIDPTVAKDFKEQLPHLHAEYTATMTAPEKPAQNPNGFAPIAPSKKQQEDSVGTHAQSDYIGKMSDTVAEALKSDGGQIKVYTPLTPASLKLLNTVSGSIGRHPAFEQIVQALREAENSERKKHEYRTGPELKTDKEWISYRDSHASVQDLYDAAVKDKLPIFATESRKARGLGITHFKIMDSSSRPGGKDYIFMGTDKTEFVINSEGGYVRNLNRPCNGADSWNYAALQITMQEPLEGESLHLSAKTISGIFMSAARKKYLRDTMLIALAYHAQEAGKPIQLYHESRNGPIPVDKLVLPKDGEATVGYKLDKQAILDMAGLGIDIEEVAKKYNKDHELECAVGVDVLNSKQANKARSLGPQIEPPIGVPTAHNDDTPKTTGFKKSASVDNKVGTNATTATPASVVARLHATRKPGAHMS